MPDPAPARLLLLDTHVWIWGVEGVPGRIASAALAEVEAARRERAVLVSAMSLWEVAMLESRGRIKLGLPIAEWFDAALRSSGARLLPLVPEVAVASTRLPGTPHADPADLILMASARVTGAPLVTCDGRILQYAAGGHVPVLDARA